MPTIYTPADATALRTAFNAFVNGDTIKLAAGVDYVATAITGPWIITKSGLTLTSTGTIPAAGTRATMALHGAQFGALVPLQTSGSTNVPGLMVNPGLSNITIDGVIVRQSFQGGDSMLQVGANNSTQVLKSQIPTNITVRHVVLDTTGQPLVGHVRGIQFHATGTIKDNSITSGSPAGVKDAACLWICNTNGAVDIENNDVDGGTYGILFMGDEPKVNTRATVLASPAPTITGCRVRITNDGDPAVFGQVVVLRVNGFTENRHPLMASVTAVGGSALTANGWATDYDLTYNAIDVAPDAGMECRWGVIPDGCTIQYNHIHKPTSWRDNAMLATPVVTATPGTAGTLVAGTYSYRVTAIGVGTQGNNVYSNATTSVSVGIAASGSLDLSWAAITNATSYYVFVTFPNGNSYRFTVAGTSTTITAASATVATPPSGSKWSVKNLLEFKALLNSTIKYNEMHACWPGIDNGQCIWAKSEVQAIHTLDATHPWTADTAPASYSWSTNVEVAYNKVYDIAGFMNISGCNWTTGNSNLVDVPKTMDGLNVHDNLVYGSTSAWRQGKTVRLFNVANGCVNLTINHNTAPDHDSFGFISLQAKTVIPLNLGYFPNMKVTNNIFKFQQYGMKGETNPDTSVGTTAFNAHTQNSGTFGFNAIMGLVVYTSSSFPNTANSSPNIFPITANGQAGFTNFAAANFSIVNAGIYDNTGSAGSDMGADVATILTQTATVVAGAAAATNPSIATNALPGATVGQPYTATIVGQDGTGTRTFTVTTGTLPTGLAISSVGGNGQITGTPTGTAGTVNFTVTVTDGSAHTGTKALSIIVVAAPVVLLITPGALPEGSVGQPYVNLDGSTVTMNATGGIQPYLWELDDVTPSGPLPDGLTLNPDGTITGTPTGAFDAPVIIRVIDGLGNSAIQTLTFVVGAQGYLLIFDEKFDQAIQWYRTTIANSQRGARLQTPYDTNAAFLKDEILVKTAPYLKAFQAYDESAQLLPGYRKATIATQTAVKQLLPED